MFSFRMFCSFFLILCSFQFLAAEEGEITFTAPLGWRFAEDKDLPKTVKVMVIGKGDKEFPPSINLGTESYDGTLKQYLKRIKEINASQGFEWKDLGTIDTKAGKASLSQVDTLTKWGQVRMMHVILLKNKTIYIMTAASHKDEFSKYYQDFFAAFRSLNFILQPAAISGQNETEATQKQPMTNTSSKH